MCDLTNSDSNADTGDGSNTGDGSTTTANAPDKGSGDGDSNPDDASGSSRCSTPRELHHQLRQINTSIEADRTMLHEQHTLILSQIDAIVARLEQRKDDAGVRRTATASA